MLKRLLISLFSAFTLIASVSASPLFYAFPFASANDTSEINTIRLVDGGGMWLLDSKGHVYFYDGVHYHPLNAFYPLTAPVSDIEYFDGALWLISEGKLKKYDSNENTLTLVSDLSGKALSLKANSDALWVSSDEGLYKQTSSAAQPHLVSTNSPSAMFASEDHLLMQIADELIDVDSGDSLLSIRSPVLSVAIDETRVWVGSDKGITLFEGGIERATFLTQYRVTHIALTQEGIWAGTPNGLFWMAKSGSGNTAFIEISGDSEDALSFSGKVVKAMALSQSGELWVASDSGLNYRSAAFQKIERFPPFLFENDPTEEPITALIPSQDGYLVGTQYNLIKLDRLLNQIKSTKLDIAIDSLQSLGGMLWGATASGVKAYSLDDLTQVASMVPDALRGFSVDRVISDSHSLWVTSGSRLLRFWPASQTVIDFGYGWSGSDSNRLTSVADLGSQGVWLGTTDGVYLYFDGRFIPRLSRDQIGTVKSMSVDANGQLWLLTNRGTFQYDPAGSATPTQQYASSPTDTAKCLVSDNESAFTVTSKGIKAQSLVSGEHSFTQGPSFSSPSPQHFCLSDRDNLVLAGDYGVFSIPKPTLAVEHRTDNASIFPSAIDINGKPWRLGPVSSSPVIVSAKDTVAVSVGQLPYLRNELIAYQLKGNEDNNWYLSGNSKLVFSALGAGQYDLKLRLSPEDEASGVLTLASFRVTHSWLQYLGYTLVPVSLLILAVVVYFRQKQAAIKAQNRQLRETVHRKVVEIDQREESTKRFCRGVSASEGVEPSVYPLTVSDSPIADTEASGSNEWKQKVLAEIQTHFHDPEYSTSLLAKALFLSERSLQRRFKSEFDCTFKELLIETRLDNARRMLCQGDKIADVAVACGFNEPSYFAKSFKAKYGSTPSQYRDKCGSGCGVGEKKKSVV